MMVYFVRFKHRLTRYAAEGPTLGPFSGSVILDQNEIRAGVDRKIVARLAENDCWYLDPQFSEDEDGYFEVQVWAETR